MKVKPHKIIIIGAGTGGLCLAQGLKSEHMAVEVYERDHTPADRLQGYRLSINAGGINALRICLPAALFEKLIRNSAVPSQGVTFLDHQLNRLLSIDLPRNDENGLKSEMPVSRLALRSILLEGLDEVVHFGKKFTVFKDAPDGGVTACFEDGSMATGDVLVGADGAGSHLREQLLPQAKRVETGILAISGKVGLNAQVRAATPQVIFRGPTLVLGPKGCFLFASAVDYGLSSGQVPGDNKASMAGGSPVLNPEEYVMWGFSARQQKFGLSKNPATLNREALKDAVLGLMDEWHPTLLQLVRSAEPCTVTAFQVKTSVPVPPWHTRNVTLLGDALHNMTPFRGIGANTALRDAAALRKALVATDREEIDLIPALAAYERDMVQYGFQAVRTSLAEMNRVHSEGLSRAMTKTLFRTIDLIPPLKSAFHG